jgi:hypothetical protein
MLSHQVPLETGGGVAHRARPEIQANLLLLQFKSVFEVQMSVVKDRG